ncbi:inactive TPR repeat-containing thioredoxin TTL3 [Cucumis melo var. makuwa]|uniref:Inactive TPR repeat-containing thioredoxin TTL3 n=2 Tax=Cucumis melo TaxID=3656 RepID=A0A5D3CZF3_CUCMM|nr:inactive TPR repeat-containing thioredoxin TTL3 [Cucumis melo]KAA0044719.1 inactive TPR repeat-containing thioredoxin TTL3 [Cucumis melo var. makuwa]TYK16740.1 inactive TPR repeat-containing thioredoxin TTL3 [Cucumis melo var. makuwa]
MAEDMSEKKSSCGLLNVVFGRRGFWPRRSASNASLSTMNSNNNDFVKTASSQNSKRRRGGSDEGAFIHVSAAESKPKVGPNQQSQQRVVYSNQNQNHQRGAPMNNQNEGCKIAAPPSRVAASAGNGYVDQGRRVPKEAIGISGELELMIADHQKSKGTNGSLVRASSSNVMLFGNLGNLRQGGNGGGTAYNVVDYVPKTAREETQVPNGRYQNGGMGNNTGKGQPKQSVEQTGSLCRALSTRMDPEQLKIMGNEDYKNGRFAEALALYEAAIAIDPNKASYRSNKSAVLTALGMLVDAVFECREAIRIDPRYHRAHHRLATLYLRLGDTEKAMYHYKQSGPEADQEDLAKAKAVQAHLNKCTEARRLRDWNTLIKETGFAITSGADSAPQIFALQAEAFLKLHKHQDADEAILRGPSFDVDSCTKFLGPVGNANLLLIRAQVDLAAGRFDDALEAAQRAARLDSSNRDTNVVMRRARAITAARSNGNELFKASRFSEACVAYGEGLEHDPYNSVLLCNRAACRSKLGQFEKAVEDCTAALNARPSYSKARLRRADCNAKLGKWESSIKDYEILLEQTPDDKEVHEALAKAQMQLKKQQA